MKKTLRKAFSWFIVACLVITVLPTSIASAEETRDFTQLFGYTQMKTDGQREAYIKICKAVLDMDTDGVVFEAGTVTQEDVLEICMIVPFDLPQAFYFRGPHYISHLSDGSIRFIPVFVLNSNDDLVETEEDILEVKRQKAALDAKVKKIVADVPASVDTDYEKSVYVHDLIVGMVKYKKTAHDQTAYGALIEGECVCAGYAAAYSLLMNELGVKTWMVYGVANNGIEVQPHAWNVAWLNGVCVYTDPTWGDLDTYTQYSYLNISGVEMARNHQMKPMYTEVLPECYHANYKHELGAVKVQAIELNIIQQKITTIGGKWQIKGRVIPENADDPTVIFFSNNPSVATVNNEGVVTAVSEGTATITIRSLDGGALTTATVTVALPKCEHELALEKLVEATCQSSGIKAHYRCKICDARFLDKNGHVPTTPEKLVIQIKAHEPGEMQRIEDCHWRNCSQCNGEITPKEAHAFGEEGYCTVCGYATDGNHIVPNNPTEPSQKLPSQLDNEEGAEKSSSENNNNWLGIFAVGSGICVVGAVVCIILIAGIKTHQKRKSSNE